MTSICLFSFAASQHISTVHQWHQLLVTRRWKLYVQRLLWSCSWYRRRYCRTGRNI